MDGELAMSLNIEIITKGYPHILAYYEWYILGCSLPNSKEGDR